MQYEVGEDAECTAYSPGSGRRVMGMYWQSGETLFTHIVLDTHIVETAPISKVYVLKL